MLIGILFTGALRTIVKTIKFMKQNLVLDDNYHIYACVQNDTNKPNQYWSEFLHSTFGNNIKSIDWYNSNNSEKGEILKYVNISDNWKNYLKTSGSMVEHHQIQIAYKKLCYIEGTINIKYDYIVRYRTDTVFGKKIDFHWINWTRKEIDDRLDMIRCKLVDKSNENIIKHFMGTLLDDCILDNDISLFQTNNDDDKYQDIINNLENYLKYGKYILTFRKNLLYIVKRNYFYLIPCIYNLYGTIRYKYNDDYWFNSEGQFQGACYNCGLSLYNYDSKFDEMSLYAYDHSRYFDSDNNIINPNMIYCLVRN